MTGDNAGFASVVFDFDSTLSAIEGVDVLAGAVRDEVRELTDRAMTGEVPLEEVYGRRLELIRPTKQQVEHLGIRYVEALVPDAAETVGALKRLDKQVRVVSGGILHPVLAAARAIGFRDEEVAAVPVEFGYDDEYAGFDDSSPLTRSDGKATVIRSWNLPGPVLLVGDGATDLEARPAVDAFAAFLGVEHRKRVAERADFVIDGPSIAPVLQLAASPEEIEFLRGTRWAPLLDHAGPRRVAPAAG